MKVDHRIKNQNCAIHTYTHTHIYIYVENFDGTFYHELFVFGHEQNK
jgi:hypothetical protein